MKRKWQTDLTNEQIEFRNKILKIKYKPKKENRVRLQEAPTRNAYMNNCMFWINEFEAGRETVERFMNAVISLRNHCNQIINEHKK